MSFNFRQDEIDYEIEVEEGATEVYLRPIINGEDFSWQDLRSGIEDLLSVRDREIEYLIRKIKELEKKSKVHDIKIEIKK